MQYGLSMKWHNSCNRQTDRQTARQTDRQTDRQTVVALYFLCAPKIHTLKKQAFFVRSHADKRSLFCHVL